MNKQNTPLIESVPSAKELRKVPGFDPLKFLRKTVSQTGETALKLDLPYKRLWFRLACPDGRMVLNHLRITDQMAIFEARLYAGKDDASLLSSFTATKTAQDRPGGQYVRAAQDEALNEALDNAGFGIQLCDVAQVSDGSGFGSEIPLEQPQTETPVEKAAPVAQNSVEEVPPTEPPTQAAPSPAPPAKEPPAPQAAPKVISMPAREAPPASTAGAEPAPTAEAIASQAEGETPVSDEASQEPPRYTADMAVDEICALMTLDEAKQVEVPLGSCKGMTLGEVAEKRKANLKWYLYANTDNIVKAGASMLMEHLGLKKTG